MTAAPAAAERLRALHQAAADGPWTTHGYDNRLVFAGVEPVLDDPNARTEDVLAATAGRNLLAPVAALLDAHAAGAALDVLAQRVQDVADAVGGEDR